MSENKKRLDNLSPLKRALVAMEEMKGKINTLQKEKNEPIAVVGLSCRFPGARNAEEFWQLLRNGVDAISEVPAERWDIDEFYDPEPGKPGKMSTKWGGFIEDVDKFDPQFFGISPREAYKMDPQQRLLLEVAWEALEDAGYTLPQLSKSKTGVFIGISNNDYSTLKGKDYSLIDAYAGTGNAFSIAANRLSYTLDLTGPSIAIDTACSSSLVATHLACQSLRNKESDLALAGGAGIILSPELTITFSQAQMMGPGGRCRTFDAGADGYVRGEGIGIIVLKRLSDAKRDKDHILSIIRGSAVNQDGKSNGITAPNSLAQQKVIRQAMKNAGVKPEDIDYVEAHGTGTILGDPIEVQALGMVMKNRPLENKCYLGSVKTNIGHLEAAAGVAGIIKTILTLKNRQIPPHLHFKKINPHIAIDEMPFAIPTELVDWKDDPKRHKAGISAFGFGGTNAHIIMEEAPAAKVDAPEAVKNEKTYLIPLSAQNEEALRDLAAGYLQLLQQSDQSSPEYLYTIGYNAALRRNAFDNRLVLISDSTKDLAEQLQLFLDQEQGRFVNGISNPALRPKIAFVYSGQGPQWYAMGRELLENEPVFAESIETISNLLKQYTNWNLKEELLRSEADSRLDQTEIAQPALFAIQVALSDLWKSWGIIPDSVTGHSVGEVAAAYVSGVLSLEDAVKVIYHRSRLMQQATGLGKMAAVDLDYDALKEVVSGYEDRVALGAHNSHTSNVLSGEEAAIDEILGALASKDVFCKKLPVNYAFHSPQMEPFRKELEAELSDLQTDEMAIQLVSTVTGKPAEPGDYNGAYWGRNIREQVHFSEAIDHLIETQHNIFIEVGPHPVLRHYIRQNLDRAEKTAFVLPSLRRKEAERAAMLRTIGTLFTIGFPVNWNKLYPHFAGHTKLPFYPFQRERFWLDTVIHEKAEKEDKSEHPLLGKEHHSALMPNNSNWTVQLKYEYVSYLNNGRDTHLPVLPEAAYLEMAIAASAQTFHTENTVLRNIVFKKALSLTEKESRQLHFTLTPVSAKKAYFQAYSKTMAESDPTNWVMHSLGSVDADTDMKTAPEIGQLDTLKKRLHDVGSVESFLDQLKDNLLTGDPSGLSISEIFIGENEILAHFSFQNLQELNPEQYKIHPLILDHLFRLITVRAQIDEQHPLFYKPHSMASFSLFQQPASKMWVHVHLEKSTDKKPVLLSQMEAWDEDGMPILKISDLRLQTISLDEAMSQLFYEVEWEPVHPETARRKTMDLPKRWLIFGDQSERSQTLLQELSQKGKSCTVAHRSSENKQLREGLLHFNPADPEGFKSLLESVISPDTAILYLWGLEDTNDSIKVLETTTRILHELKNAPAETWLFTENAVALESTRSEIKSTQAILWDLGVDFQMVFKKAPVFQVDVQGPVKKLLDILHFFPNENTLVLRSREILVPRLIRSAQLVKRDIQTKQLPALSDERTKPDSTEIEIEVMACSVNSQYLKSLALDSQQSPGMECSGIIRSVGKEVKDFKVGDEVIAISFSPLKRFVLTSESLVRIKPKSITFEQAAAFPLSYLASYYALAYLGRLQKHESLLIHDAHTPFGRAAIQIARRYEATIYATVQSEAQKEELEQFGIKHVFSSDSLSYIDRISDITGGRGVDIIVNTLENEQLAASFSILKDFGRFLELNTNGSFEQPMVYYHLRRNVSFFAVDMMHVAARQPDLTKELFGELLEMVDNDELQFPENVTVPYEQAAANPALLAEETLENNKLVLTLNGKMTKSVRPAILFQPQKTYLVAGSPGFAELALVDWMQRNGAEQFLVANIFGDDIKKEFKPPKELKINYINDLTKINPEQIQGVFLSLDPDEQDSLKVKKAVETVFSIFSNQQLDYFVTLSLFRFGLPNHPTKTAFRPDYLALSLHQQRWEKDLNSLHLQLAGKANTYQEAFMRWNVLSRILTGTKGRIIITEDKWEDIFGKLESNKIPAIFSHFLPKSAHLKPESSAKPGFDISRNDLLAAAEDKREEMLHAYLCSEIAHVVKVPVQKIKLDQPLTALGIDSLMAIELKNTVESKLALELPIATLLQGPSIMDLTAAFLPQLTETDVVESTQPVIEKKSNELREFKLSHGQKAMYFQHMMNPDSIFNLAYAVRIRSAFDKEMLRNSFQALVDRHPSLRTTFHLVDNQPIQRIHPDMPAFFYEESVANLSDEQIKVRFDEEVLNHFDLENGPLMRVFLFERNDNDSFLLFVMHHIVTDIWSQALLLNELSQIFAAGGDATVLPFHSEDYTDFIRWQDRMLESEKGAALLSYWKHKLAGELPKLNIPTDRPRPSVQTYRGKTETVWFPEALSNEIHRFAKEHGTTVFTLMLTAYYVFLNRYTGQDDLIVGSPTAGRSKKEFAEIIGYFVNPVPFRANLRNNPGFLELLEQVKTTVLEAFENMDYPLTLMVEKLQPERDLSRTPLFQTMFILQRAHLMHDQGLSKFALSREGASLDMGGLTIESMNLEQGVAPFDLTMMAVESGSGLAASLGYNVDLFEAETIRRMLAHFTILLQEIVANPNQPINNLSMLPEAEQHKLLTEWNATEDTLDTSVCVHELIEKQAAAHPQKTALKFESEALSYEILNQRANQLARHLHEQGVGSESLVGICLERSLDMVIAMLGVLKAGAAYVPIDPTYPQERIRYMFSDARLKTIISHSHLMSKLDGTSASVVLLDETAAGISKLDTHDPKYATDPSNLAYIIYTSGSTGKPKGTMLMHRNLTNALHSTRKKYYVTEDSVVLQFASFSFDASVEEIFSALTAGATLHLVRKETLLSLAELIDLINKQGITNMTLPPSVLSVLQPKDFPKVRSVISAGEKCPPEVAKRWSEGRHFINGYGPTEATICTTTFEVDSGFERYAVPIGKPIGNVKVYVLDSSLQPVPTGVPGELFIGGAGIARGYFNRPELTAERFIPDPFSVINGARMYRTGDLVRYLPDGNLEFMERIDQQVKIRGFRIELGEIESALKNHASVQDAAVIARRQGGEVRLLAYLIPEKGQDIDDNVMRLFLKNHLPDYMIPSAFTQMEHFPLTSNGKLDQKALPDPEAGAKGQTFVKPGSEVERKLAAIWQEVLQIEQVGINDSFFDLGGHSLGIVQVQGKIKEVFDKDVNVVDMFKYPTISSLAKFLSDEDSSKQAIKKSMDRASRQREATKMQQQRTRSRRRNK